MVKPFYNDPASSDARLMSKTVAVVVVVVITLVNALRVSWAVRVQDIFTVLKLVALALICIVGLVRIKVL